MPVTLATRPNAPSRTAIEAGLKAFFNIADAWGLDTEQGMVLLGKPSRQTYFNWKNAKIGTVTVDLATRVSLILGIYKSIQILISNADTADSWVKRPNDVFGGKSALDRMLAGQITDLAAVRNYLDAVRGGW